MATGLDATIPSVVEMETVTIEHAAGLLGITYHTVPPVMTQTAVAVPHAAAVTLPARIATAVLSCRMFNAPRANGSATWPNIATCWPLQSALRGT